MKTHKINSGKTVTTMTLIITLLVITACGNADVTLAQEKRQSIVLQTGVEPPDINIHTATFMGNVKAIKQHIKAGSDLDEKDEYGSTPLIIAATFGKTDAAIALINGGANVDLKNNEGSTPLHVAAFFCRREIVKALLDHGADKTLKNNYGSTPLESVAAPFGNVKAIYDQISKDLGPLGLKLDYKQLEMIRPEMAKMLQ
jgi:ankyrin repeat protein